MVRQNHAARNLGARELTFCATELTDSVGGGAGIADRDADRATAEAGQLP
ncbi:hypothetical protein [Kitasatospora sp. CB01950]|nr:hypothetical protein [Kitasatospora sp. CB01950]